MKELLKDEYQDYEDSFNIHPFNGLRVNTSKITVEDFLKICPFELERIPWTSDGFYYKEEDRPSKHPYYYAGLYYLQEPSAMLPAEVLSIEENDKVLDICAAPGGKSTKLGVKLNSSGILYSNDVSVTRGQALLKNIELFGIKNAFVLAENSTKLKQYFSDYFDKILVDAPCSGEGMFRKDKELIKSWVDRNDTYFSPIQKEILCDSIEMLKDGGMLVYSTCTFSKEEDEEVIKYALKKYPNVKQIKIDLYDGFVRGENDIGIKLFPHKVKGEGHFVCLLQKGEKKQKEDIDIKKTNYQNNFINIELNNSNIENINDKCLGVPNSIIGLNGLRVLRSGLLIGENTKSGFEPNVALALAIKKDNYSNVIDFNVNDNRVIKYLKGETIAITDFNIKDGYVLICVDSYPLGFAKVAKGVFKNKYPKGWLYK